MEVRYFPSQCQAAGITDQEACAKFIEISNLPLLCRDNGATTRDECEKMQRRNFLAPACANQGILDSAACEAFAAANIKGQVSCPGLSSEECGLKIRNRSLGGILEAQSRIENVRQRLAEFKDKHVEIVIVPEGKQPTAEQARIRDVMPVEPDEDRGFSLVDSESGIGFTADERVVTASPAFLMYDTDGDGMPDDVEQRHGSDPTKKDTNDDGIADGDEFKAMLAGKTKPGLVELAPIEKAVILGKAVGQPILEGALDEALKVEKAVSEALPKTTAAANVKSKAPPLKLSGKGRAGTVLTLYVYSNLPLVATVTVDANGQWNYDISDPLKDGEHTVYVAINDDTGKVVTKSSPLSFFVRAAQAESPASFVGAALAAEQKAAVAAQGEVNVETRNKESLYKRYFLVGSLALLALAGAALYVLFKKKSPAVQ